MNILQHKANLKKAKAAKGELKVNVNGVQEILPAAAVDDAGLFLLAYFGSGLGENFTGVSFILLKDHLGTEVGPSDGSIFYWEDGEIYSSSGSKLKVSHDSVGDLYFGSLSAEFTETPVKKTLTDGIFSVSKE
ncbi:hypothetical protein PMI18_01119 [Pseudomonas sp. GM102]|uniref:hypothetical protein n=1 Tax=Pseudomonas sp. GM102 TaxID=1144321 RepID=UPI00026F4B83|nr:hypothetical protein [Pseudomonas sp. GM102]EJM05504.1 hypothetical protein PMI18_01119 [Pseudomonas sp. GM102]